MTWRELESDSGWHERVYWFEVFDGLTLKFAQEHLGDWPPEGFVGRGGDRPALCNSDWDALLAFCYKTALDLQELRRVVTLHTTILIKGAERSIGRAR